MPVLENFGFRVLEEMPTSLGGGALGYIHDFRVEIAGEADLDVDLRPDRGNRARDRQRARAASAENDEFNQLVLYAGLDTQPVVWLRAWFRYLRQTGARSGW